MPAPHKSFVTGGVKLCVFARGGGGRPFTRRYPSAAAAVARRVLCGAPIVVWPRVTRVNKRSRGPRANLVWTSFAYLSAARCLH